MVSNGKIYLYNTLKRKKEEFKPIKEGNVGFYSCGPTVYWYQHVGNFRTVLLNDLLKRTLIYNNYKVNHVMNITDVDDKTIKGSIKEGITLKELTQKYEKIFFEDLESLNVIKPTTVLHATENIKEMVKIIEKLLKKDYAYKTTDGIYFSINNLYNYGELARLENITNTKKRIISDEYDKSNPQDFALWKFYTPEDGEVFWETSIGKGRPGWHIECSAMSMKALGETFDVHTGGMDLIFPHHTNEIAQSEASTGKKFVNYWVHGGMLNMKEGKMSKSLGNIYTIRDLKEKGFEPVIFRYLCLQTHYRKPLEFSFENLESAKNAYNSIISRFLEFKERAKEFEIRQEIIKPHLEAFKKAINDDLNSPQSLATMHNTMSDKKLNDAEKHHLMLEYDKVFGLGLDKIKAESIPKEIIALAKEREEARKAKDWKKSDLLRNKIKKEGYTIEDSPEGYKIIK